MSEKLVTGAQAPNFSLPNQDDKTISLEDYLGKWLILYFYPRDNTSGCTLEALEFTNHLETIKSLGGLVAGVSGDSVKSHKKFKNKHELKVELLSDPEHKTLEDYGVWQLKKNYGREYYGIVRGTFLIDDKGKIAEIWPKVRVKGHVDQVLDTLKKLVKKS